MGGAGGGLPIGRREQDDPGLRRWGLEARIREATAVGREHSGAERSVAADEPGDVLGPGPIRPAAANRDAAEQDVAVDARCLACGADRIGRTATGRRARGGGAYHGDHRR